jgi:hypothetical protein
MARWRLIASVDDRSFHITSHLSNFFHFAFVDQTSVAIERGEIVGGFCQVGREDSMIKQGRGIHEWGSDSAFFARFLAGQIESFADRESDRRLIVRSRFRRICGIFAILDEDSLFLWLV